MTRPETHQNLIHPDKEHNTPPKDLDPRSANGHRPPDFPIAPRGGPSEDRHDGTEPFYFAAIQFADGSRQASEARTRRPCQQRPTRQAETRQAETRQAETRQADR